MISSISGWYSIDFFYPLNRTIQSWTLLLKRKKNIFTQCGFNGTALFLIGPYWEMIPIGYNTLFRLRPTIPTFFLDLALKKKKNSVRESPRVTPMNSGENPRLLWRKFFCVRKFSCHCLQRWISHHIFTASLLSRAQVFHCIETKRNTRYSIITACIHYFTC